MAKVPYKYNEETIPLATEYLNSCGNENMELPTVEGLALKLGIDDDTLVRWAEKYDEFREIYKKLKMLQKVQLINGGMYGGKEVNASMFIFLLKVNHNMIETSKLSLGGQVDTGLSEVASALTKIYEDNNNIRTETGDQTTS